MAHQNTIAREIALSGIGIHSAEEVNLVLRPSSAGEIIFCRKDLENRAFRLDAFKVKAKRGSVLETDAGTILTIEHLLAALYMLGIDSVVVELDGGEIPVMDGSAAPFVGALEQAGITPLPGEKKLMRIIKPGIIEEGGSSVSFSPGSGLTVSYAIEYDHPLINRQELSLRLSVESFREEIAPARTFGFLEEVPFLLQQGLARGGSLMNAVVLDDKGVVGGALRFPDEFVRHKILDFTGDLSLLGHPVSGHFKAIKAGHSLHLKAVRFMLENPEFWQLTD